MSAAVPVNPDELPSTRVYDASARRYERTVILAITGIPFLGFIAGAVYLASGRLALHDHVIFLVMYLITCLGVGIGFHRLFTHRGFEAPAPLRLVLAILGSMAVQGPVLRWTADHRRHHAYSDRDGDPHSPVRDQHAGLRGLLSGMLYAHIGWFFDAEKTTVKKWVPDLRSDPVVRFVDRYYLLWPFVSLAIPTVAGYALTGTLQGTIAAFLWGGLTRIFVLQHMTWSVNSICHTFGRRPHETRDRSRNNWLLAVPSLGEAWHNNHHFHPAAAIHGFTRYQIDISGMVIRAMEALGWIRNVQRARLNTAGNEGTTR
jgi:stearoyl-CoA desaturase (Delta-9 desaturase)